MKATQIFSQSSILRLELRGNLMTDDKNPFVLLARITGKEGMANAYLEIAKMADKAVEKNGRGYVGS